MHISFLQIERVDGYSIDGYGWILKSASSVCKESIDLHFGMGTKNHHLFAFNNEELEMATWLSRTFEERDIQCKDVV